MAQAQVPFYPTFKKLLKHILPYKWLFAGGVIGSFLYATVDAIFTKYFTSLVDKGLVERDQEFIKLIPFIILSYFLLRGIGSFISTYCMGLVGRKVVKDFRKKILNWLLLAPAQFYHDNTSSHLISKINYDTEQVAEVITNAITDSIRGVLITIGLVYVMFTINWQITCLFILIVPVLATYMNHVSKKMRKHSSNIQKTIGDVTQVAQEITEGYQVIRAYGGHQYERNRINEVTDGNYFYEKKMIKTIAISAPAMQIITSLAFAALIYLATLPATHPLGTGMSAGEFSAMMIAMLNLTRPIKQVAMVSSAIQRGVAAAFSIFSVIEMPIENDSGTKRIKKCKGKIEFENVSFKYKDKLNLDNINFKISPGETVAFIGNSGGGKSTIVSLLPRFYEATKGTVKLDGIPIDQLHLSDLRNQIAIVSQHVTLFNDTIANNIAYGSQDQAKLEDIVSAAKLSFAYEFIEQLPHGFNTMIGERGLNLSGGQRQRLSLARAILKDAPILILDEATSALDNELEESIKHSIHSVMKNKTIIIIAHRLSSIEKVDKVFVVDGGQVVDQGSYNSICG